MNTHEAQLGRPSSSPVRTTLLVLSSVIVGFLLPVCSCAVLLFTVFGSLVLVADSSTPNTGFGDAVAIVRVEGVIDSGNSDDFGPGATSGVVIEDLRSAETDPTVKAIVLRVDSPGGGVTGSAQIHEVVQQIEKPLVVSMASVAASGGYYVSAPGDFIYARADTVTGSLGVIMTLFNAEKLVDELGVEVVTLTTGPNKALGSLWEELTPEHREILNSLIDESYDQFVQIVADGRDMSRAEVLELADGRIFSGRQALDAGLVDALGNLQDAIAKAADLGGIDGQPRIVEYQHIPGLDQLLLGYANRLSGAESDRVMEIVSEFTTPSLEYRYVGPRTE